MKIKAFTATVFALLMTAAVAQAQKFGYTNVEYIVAFMPEAQTVQTELTEYENQLTQQIQSKYQTLQQKVAEYEQTAATMIDAVRADKEAEIQQLQGSLQQFQAQAEGLMQQKQGQLLQPLYNKIQEAIDAVAEENGYSYIFNSSSLLYAPEGDEISDLVFKKLGIEPPAFEEGQAQPGAAPATGSGGQ